MSVELRYGPGPEQVADLRLPTRRSGAAPPALVVVVHGGFWKAEWDRAHAGPQSAALAEAGYAVVTPEYRRVGGPGGGWPGTFDDVAACLDRLPGLVAAATGDDPAAAVAADRPVLVGHSAGGHLALWSAARHRLPTGSPWHRATPVARGVVALAPVADLEQARRDALGGGAVQALLGLPARHPQRYAVADPTRLVPSGVPTVCLHGADDDVVPPGQSEAYAEAARAAGEAVDVRRLAGVGHFELIEPGSTAWPEVLDAVARLAR